MAKLYPPYIEGTLPAFSLDSSGNGIITIPFELNKAVSKEDLEGKEAYVKVKTVQNDVLLTTIQAIPSIENKIITIQVENNYPSNDENKTWNIKVGQYYKLQVAFADGNEIGYYSTVGVIKCTSKPELSILGFSISAINNNKREFVGQFLQGKEGDVTEKVYSSKFTIKDSNGKIIETTGDVLHNVENNPNSYSSIDTMMFNRDLELGKIYTITYTVTTTNGLVESVTYYLEQPRSIKSDFNGEIDVKLNKEESYIELSLIGSIDEESGNENPIDGTFLISREDQMKKNYWDPIYQFTANHQLPSELALFKDFTIEQGKTYKYSIQQVNEYGIYSDRIESKLIYSDFDDMFLFDGKRQLKIQFNPQVSSFKTQLAESKVDTIGSKYPFFFRNARVEYKTFPISGLISMFIDDNQNFIEYEDILREDFTKDRHFTSKKRKKDEVYDQHWEIDHNFISERLFKIEVLDWFNDGKVKLFKSPAEGNYLVRLMDTSLSPQTALGRMLHTINATAYECADLTYDTLVKYGILEEIKGSEAVEETYDTLWNAQSILSLIEDYNIPDEEEEEEENSTIPFGVNENIENKIWQSPFKQFSENSSIYYWGLLNDTVYYITELKLEDFTPGTKFKLILSNNKNFNNPNSITIQIGPTGSYYASGVIPIYQVYLIQDTDEIISLSGSIQYLYRKPVHKKFNLIKETISKIGWYRQLVGNVPNIIDVIKNTKEEPLDITMTNFKKRPIEYLYYKDKLELKSEDLFEKVTYHKKQNSFYVGTDVNESGFDKNGYRKLTEKYKNKLYWDSSFDEDKIFNDKDSLEYSPFTLYVLKSSSVNGEDIIDHDARIKEPLVNSTDLHIDNHMFEKYYIDRYLFSKTAEEVLTEKISAELRIQEIEKIIENNSEEINEELSEEKEQLENFPDVFVVDPLFGKIYKVGIDEENGEFLYNPSIDYLEYVKNNEEFEWQKISNIDLREIERYELNDLDPTKNSFSIGNGVYGEIFYDELETTYSIEEENSSEPYNAWQNYKNLLNNRKNYELTFEDQYKLEILYKEFDKKLAKAIKEWEDE